MMHEPAKTLTGLAEQVAVGATSVANACRQAQEVTGGSIRKLMGFQKAHVLPSMGEIEQQLSALSTYINAKSYDDVRRWSGALIMVHAHLGMGNLNPAVELVQRVAGTTKVPEGAGALVAAMIDALLEHAEMLEAGLPDRLLKIRRRFSNLLKADTVDLNAIDIITGCFDQEGWQYYLDREEKKIQIQFFSPLGTTRLVCALSAEDHLAIVAIEVIQAAEEELTTIEKSLEEFEGVEAFRHPDRGTVSLQYGVRGAASSLTKAQVRTAVVHVNAAAEHLLLMKK